jgi:preprotein translocase subunit SecA
MVLNRLLRAGENRRAKQIWKTVAAVNALSEATASLSDQQLQARTVEFKERIALGASTDELLVEAYAVVREAAWRVLGQRPYDVQVFGAIALHQGSIAEMKTGEGKTLTSTMPVYLNALTGRGVHVVTVNEYLAQRDAEWMGRIHRFLGLEVGVVLSGQGAETKRAAYAADITYGTNNEFGFDYLRDNMAHDPARQVQRGLHFALVDEIDSILIDEARTPLIVSGMAERSADLYKVFARRVVPNLVRGEEGERPGEATGDYVVDETKRTIAVTDEGLAKVEKLLGVGDLYDQENTSLAHHLDNAIKAVELYRRDLEYLVADGEVQIVDEHTGRVLEGRRYSDGLHQAIEAKEGVKVKDETQTLATITLQNYYRSYAKLAGMTGTAKTEESEFLEIYDLAVVEVPTNRETARIDATDLVYKTEVAKFKALVADIERRHELGQPVLVGTTSVAKSELVSKLLKRRGIRHAVLNAKHHSREADIIAQAGRLGAVTVATNMAGRGTDILLGGNPEAMAASDTAKLGKNASDEERDAAYAAALARHTEACRAEGEQVLALGGLYVLGTGRHESRRVDNQLRGRAGRQGDPGETRFYLSLDDDLLRLFGGKVESLLSRMSLPEDLPIENKLVTRAVASAQQQVESMNFDARKEVLKYDDVMNDQRKVVYEQRQKVLAGDDSQVSDIAQRFIEDTIEELVDQHCPAGVYPEEWDLNALARDISTMFDPVIDLAAMDAEKLDRGQLTEELIVRAFEAYDQREREVGDERVMRQVERRIVLGIVDRTWRRHLYDMEALRDGIGFRAMAQQDPLVAYRRETYEAFVEMMAGIKREAASLLYRVSITRQD